MNINDYPILFGQFSLNESLPQNKIAYKRRVGIPNFLSLYQSGFSKEITQFDNGSTTVIIFGRIYAPFQINQYDKENDNKSAILSQMPLKEIEGSFVHIQIIREDNRITLHLSTDKYGFRPFFYFRNQGQIYFTTHLAGLSILLKGQWPTLSDEALLHYYNFGFTPNHQTLLQGIQKIPPASTLTIEKDRFLIAPYFSIAQLYQPDKYLHSSENEICQTIDHLFLEAVQNRIPTKNQEVGVALSGGVDSGYIAQKLVQSHVPVIGYNLAYGKYYDEFTRINFLATHLGIEIRKIIVTPEQVISNFEEVNRFSSEPTGFNNATMRFVAQAAQKDQVGALFDGDGADRLFLGMNRYLQYQKVIRSYSLLKKLKLLPFITLILPFLPNIELKKLSIHFHNWQQGIPPYPERDMGGLHQYNQDYEQTLYELAVKRFREDFDKVFKASHFGDFFTYQSIHMCPEMFFYDPCEIQTPLGLFPIPAFWADSLVSLAISLPTTWKLRHGKTKYILRKAAARNLDPKYWMLPKIGLQNAFHYLIQSKEGQIWQKQQKQNVQDSSEYKTLQTLVPNGYVDPNKLIALIVWKQQNAL